MKTTLLAWLAALSEARTSFAALGDLKGGILDQVVDILPPPQRRALRVSLLLEDPGRDLPTNGLSGQPA